MKCSCNFFLFFAVSMGRGNTTRRGTSILLLLIFFLQMGAGLFVHNLLHDKKQSLQIQSKKQDTQEINFSCSCVDDFLMPFVGAEQTCVDQPFLVYTKQFNLTSEGTCFASLIFSSLRGPPAI